MTPLDKFGEFVTTKLRDAAIDKADSLLVAYWKAPSLQNLQTALGRLTPEQQALVRRCVIEAINSGIHDFLLALSDAHDIEQGIAVVVDGENVAALSDGLHGEPYSDDGWYARFSKHGPHPDEP